jgi:hypothetical protein
VLFLEWRTAPMPQSLRRVLDRAAATLGEDVKRKAAWRSNGVDGRWPCKSSRMTATGNLFEVEQFARNFAACQPARLGLEWEPDLRP